MNRALGESICLKISADDEEVELCESPTSRYACCLEGVVDNVQ